MSTVKVNAITDASGGNTATINSMTPTADSLQGFRNRIINGDMRIDQRNAGASVTTTSDGQYTLDRWNAQLTQSSKYSVQQTTTVPTGFVNSLRVTSSSAYTVGSGDAFSIIQYVEGFNVADLGWGAAGAKTVTLSFWARSSLTGTFGGALTNSAQNRSYPFTYTISSANTWEYKTITIAGDTSGTWLTNNGRGINIYFSLGMGSTFSGTAGAWTGTSNIFSATGATSVVGTNGATWFITGVQLEVGSTATPFERRPYGTELQLCQRYFQLASKGTLGANYNSTTAVMAFYFLCNMRANPSQGYLTGSSSQIDIIGGTQTATIVANGSNGSTQVFSASINGLSGRTAGIPVIYQDTNCYFSAEL